MSLLTGNSTTITLASLFLEALAGWATKLLSQKRKAVASPSYPNFGTGPWAQRAGCTGERACVWSLFIHVDELNNLAVILSSFMARLT
ncbi:hypothetical protein FN846DRAFT_62267 [Sphaerosporella brunnea]|uniref:Uncharacterized protein n=1 Tax=Sphaerosporella brunnea TaxID=1250544 RepID=A0A5J5ETG4_9PEZI|nr:hypothetical protein FN846DRAFT_62267 [Sphaerosporella brunnea]